MAYRDTPEDSWMLREPEPPSQWGAVFLLVGLLAVFGVSMVLFRVWPVRVGSGLVEQKGTTTSQDPSKDSKPPMVLPEPPPKPDDTEETSVPALALEFQGAKNPWVDLTEDFTKNERKFQLSLEKMGRGLSGKTFNLRWGFYRGDSELEDDSDSAIRVFYGKDPWSRSKKKPYAPDVTVNVELLANASSKLGRRDEFLVFQCLDEDQKVVASSKLPIHLDAKRLDLIAVTESSGIAERISPNAVGTIDFPYIPIAESKLQFSLELRNKLPNERYARLQVFDAQGERLLMSSSLIVLKGETSTDVFRQLFADDLNGLAGHTSLVNPTSIRWKVEEFKSADPNSAVLNQWEFQFTFANIDWKQWIRSDLPKPLPHAQFGPPIELKEDFWAHIDSAISSIPLVVRWYSENGSQQKGQYTARLDRLKTDVPLPQEAPVLEPGENQLRFECDIGGHSHAVEYLFSASLPNDATNPTPFQHAWKQIPSAPDGQATLTWMLRWISNGKLELVWALPSDSKKL